MATQAQERAETPVDLNGSSGTPSKASIAPLRPSARSGDSRLTAITGITPPSPETNADNATSSGKSTTGDNMATTEDLRPVSGGSGPTTVDNAEQSPPNDSLSAIRPDQRGSDESDVPIVVKQENDRFEYKSLRNRNKDGSLGEFMSVEEVLKMLKNKKKEFNAMVNYGGGKVCFGIDEDRESKKCVVELGMKLANEDDKKKIDDAIHRIFYEFYPSCSSDHDDYEIKWETTGNDDDKRHRFTVIINRCRAYKRDNIVCISETRIEAYTRSGSSSSPMKVEMVKERLREVALKGAVADSYRWTQASIDARLIQRLRDAYDKYKDKEIGAKDIIRILQRYATELDRQRYNTFALVEEILRVMQWLASETRCEQTKIEIADEIVFLGNCIYHLYVFSQSFYDLSESESSERAGNNECFKDQVQNIIVQLFEVCFTVAHDAVKYRHEDKMFVKATVVLAKILSTLQSAPANEDEYSGCIKVHLGERYGRLKSSIRGSGLDDDVQKRLLELHQLLLERYAEKNNDKQFMLEKSILELGYDWY